jgi:hypothetical protein
MGVFITAAVYLTAKCFFDFIQPDNWKLKWKFYLRQKSEEKNGSFPIQLWKMLILYSGTRAIILSNPRASIISAE